MNPHEQINKAFHAKIIGSDAKVSYAKAHVDKGNATVGEDKYNVVNMISVRFKDKPCGYHIPMTKKNKKIFGIF